MPEPWPVLDARDRGKPFGTAQDKSFGAAQGWPFGIAQDKLAGEKPQKIRGKIKNVGAPTFSTWGIPPCFCVSRESKRVTGRDLAWRGIKRLRNEANWSDKKTGRSPLPRYRVSAGVIGLAGGARTFAEDALCKSAGRIGLSGLGQRNRRIGEEPFGKTQGKPFGRHRVDILLRMSSVYQAVTPPPPCFS